MKKCIALFLLMFICTLLMGCANKGAEDKKVSKYELASKYELIGKINCPELNSDILDMSTYYFVTKNNEVYKFNPEKIFSNEKNCIKAEIENLDNEIIGMDTYGAIYTNDKIYKPSRDNEIFKSYNTQQAPNGTSFIVSYVNPYFTEKLKYLEKKQNSIFSTSYIKTYDDEYDIFSLNNNLYLLESKEINLIYSVTYNFNEVPIEANFEENENVLKINTFFVITDKAYYEIKKLKSNKEKCEKSADIKCEYKIILVKNGILTENYDNIIIADEYIIDNNYNTYMNIY